MDSSEDDDIPLKQKTASVKDDGEDNEKDDDTDESDQPLMKVIIFVFYCVGQEPE